MERDNLELEEAPAGGRKAVTVTELTGIIKDLLEGALPGVWVEGEISNFTAHSSGHLYFTLKDAEAQIRAVMWKGYKTHLRFTPKDGDKVIVRGRVSVYAKRGEYQLVAEAMEPKGLGALQAAFEALKKKLMAEGLFGAVRKKKIPEYPKTVGIVTSPKGAALRDMIQTINRRFPGLRVVVNPCPVQGDGAAQKIAQAIAELNEYGMVEVIIVGRGGGSLEDLWAFNEEVVARAIAASRIPVISAVGHEVDFTIADFVADLRASTPTAAAELVAPDKAALKKMMDTLARKLVLEVRGRVEAEAQAVDDCSERMGVAVRNFMEILRHRLTAAVSGLRGRNPAILLRQRVTKLQNVSSHMQKALLRLAEMKMLRLRAASARMDTVKPSKWIEERRGRVASAEGLLTRAVKRRLTSCKSSVDMEAGRLAAFDPQRVLDRGYSIVTRAQDGKVVKTMEELKPGAGIKIRVSDGEAAATVDGAPRQGNLF